MEDLPNTWPRGGLFSFSGVDGATCHSEPFVASGAEDGVGWLFWTEPRLGLLANAGDRRLEPLRDLESVCLSDCWRVMVRAGDVEGLVEGAFLDCYSTVISIRLDTTDRTSFPDLVPTRPGNVSRDISVFDCEGAWVALCSAPSAAERRFGVAISYDSEAEAVKRAKAVLYTDIKQATEDRLEFCTSVTAPDSVWNENRRAFYKAVSIMKVNVESPQQDIPCRWTTPDRMPHRHMWMWDTAFHAVGLMYLEPALAEDAVRALLAKQCDNGQLRLAAQPGATDKEEPGTQPPIVAWAVSSLVSHTDRLEFAREAYEPLVRYIEWFETHRKNGTGLYGWEIRKEDDAICGARGGESGMDNSPRFDEAESMTAVDLASYLAGEYRALEKLAKAIDRRSDVEEWRYRHLRIAEAVNEQLWDDEDRFYYDLDENGRFIPVKTTAGFMPLHGRIADRDQAEALRIHLTALHEFWTPVPLASVSQDEEQFSNDMWRGPVWTNINVLIAQALLGYGFLEEAGSLTRRSVEEITRWYSKTGCFYEYYDATGQAAPPDLPRKGAPGAQGGVGFGVVPDLNWTAASYIHFAHQLG